MSEFHHIGYAQEIIFGTGSRARLSEMAAYKRLRWIEFVDKLPGTATGKIQRVKLRA